jgi:hypothetical protein
VYGLGLLLYEMLNGTPAYPYRLRRDAEIRSAVQNGALAPLDRRDVPQAGAVQALLTQATNRVPGSRHASVIDFGKQVTGIFGSIPPARRSAFKRMSDWSMPVVVGSVVFLLMIILFAAVLQG